MEVFSTITDCDPGWDDAAAITLQLSVRKIFRVIGITTCYGNTKLSETTANVQSLLNSLSASDIPIFSGADRPARINKKIGPTLANDTFVSLGLPQSVAACQKNLRVSGKINLHFMDLLNHNPLILCLAPLTNIARLINCSKFCPKRLIILGGHLPTKTRPKFAEFNFSMDSRSAKDVLCSDRPKTLIPINICEKMPAARFLINFNGRVLSPELTMWNRIIHSYLSRASNTGHPLYDPAACLFLLFPQCFNVSQKIIDVVVSKNSDDGRLILDGTSGTLIETVVDVDIDHLVESFSKFVVEMT